jgi:hypothetical protein
LLQYGHPLNLVVTIIWFQTQNKHAKNQLQNYSFPQADDVWIYIPFFRYSLIYQTPPFFSVQNNISKICYFPTNYA